MKIDSNMANNLYLRDRDTVEQNGESSSDRHSTIPTSGLSGDWPSSSSHGLIPSSSPSHFPHPSNFGTFTQSNHSFLGDGTQPNPANGASFSADAYSSNRVATAQPSNETSQASPITHFPANSTTSSQELQLIHPQTGRPARQLLDHEKSLLESFYLLKNPSASKPTQREAEEWRLNLPIDEIEEWNNHVITRQSDDEARLRLASVEAHDSRINSIKDEEELAGRRKARLEYFARSGRQPYRRKPAKKSRRQPASKFTHAIIHRGIKNFL
jgi:hypothetical protein